MASYSSSLSSCNGSFLSYNFSPCAFDDARANCVSYEMSNMASQIEELNETSIKFTDKFHNQEVLLRIDKMRQRCNLTDITIVVDGNDFPAHRNVISAGSDYFLAMCSGRMAVASDRVEVHGITASAMNLLLDFLYRGDITITEENVEEVLCGATLLLMESVQVACSKFLKDRISLGNCWGFRAIADEFSCTELLEKVTQFMEKNFNQAAQSEEFVLVPVDQVRYFIESDEVHVSSEDELFHLLIRWTCHDPETRLKYLPELLLKLRLPYLSYSAIQSVCENDIIKRDPESMEILQKVRNGECEMTEPRKSVRSVEVLMVVGGPMCVLYNAKVDKWVPVPGVGTRHCASMTTLNNQIYLIGGSKEWKRTNVCEIYNPETNKWEVGPPMSICRSNMGVATLDGFLYAVGGYDGNSPTKEVEKYNPKTKEWSIACSMNCKRDGMCLISDEKYLYAITGYDGSKYLKSVEVYDPSANKWLIDEIPQVNEKREDAMAVYVDNKIYVVGGKEVVQTQENIFKSSGEVLDIENKTWTNICPMPKPCYQAGVAVLNKKIYICGGWDDTGCAVTTVQVYDTPLDCWSSVAPLPTPYTVRCSHLLFPREALKKISMEAAMKDKKRTRNKSQSDSS